MPDIGLSGALGVRMALTYSLLCIMVVSTNSLVTHNKGNIGNDTSLVIKPILDPKRRNELIDEAFLEQKDILLDMLESKLKEVRDKKKKPHHAEDANEPESKCEPMPKNVDVILKGHGISGIGDTDVRLKYGEDGNGTLSLDATGISNVGKVHVELGVVDGNVHIPGLDNVFTGEMLLRKGCKANKRSEVNNNSSDTSRSKADAVNPDEEPARRVDRGDEKINSVLPLNDTSNYVDKPEINDIHNNDISDIRNNNKSTSKVDNITTEVPEEIRSTTEVINDTNTLTSNSA